MVGEGALANVKDAEGGLLSLESAMHSWGGVV
jgi:hypothetical protein